MSVAMGAVKPEPTGFARSGKKKYKEQTQS